MEPNDYMEESAHAEPVAPEDLKLGGVYVLINYLDEHLLIPCVESITYLGTAIGDDSNDYHCFLPVGSEYDDKSLAVGPGTTEDQYLFEVADLGSVFDLNSAADALRRCAARCAALEK